MYHPFGYRGASTAGAHGVRRPSLHAKGNSVLREVIGDFGERAFVVLSPESLRIAERSNWLRFLLWRV